MKRFVATLASIALCVVLGGCTTSGTAEPNSDKNDDPGKTGTTVEQPEETDGPVQGLVDPETGAFGPVIVTDHYSTGIHHAVLTIKGHDPMEIEIYSDNAPETSALFCKLVRHGYYDGLRITALMPNLYAELGSHSADDSEEMLVPGEFEEAGFKSNHIGLKRGVIAMARYSNDDESSKKDGETEYLSDASGLYIFLTNASYLNGKYAGFAKITSGINEFAAICEEVADESKIKDDGTIAKKKKRPIIESIVLED